MNTRLQRRVLYREFLFRIVDRELLSSHSKGDSSQLLLQLLALFVCLSVLFSVPVLINPGPNPIAQVLFAWSVEHFLIATTMLTVGVCAVLGWGSMFPDQRDIQVLAPLPVHGRTIFLAKIAAVGTALAITVLALHVVTGVVWPVALMPAHSGLTGWLRMIAAYWLTMSAAGLFVFGSIVGLHGLAAAVLPHRIFLRVSSILQLAVFCVLVGSYFLEPMIVTPFSILAAQRASFFGSMPTYWFLGLFQSIGGATDLAPLAGRALIGLSVALVCAIGVCAISYLRTLRRLAEEPDIAPAVQAAWRLPPVGSPLHSAVVHFSARTLFRSAPHRVIFAFYLGIGFALSAVFLKTPRAQQFAGIATPGTWDETSVPLIVSSVLMMVCAIVGARLTFAMPRDLGANWIFRVLPLRGGTRYLSARRRAYLLLAAGPVWALSACVFFAMWPWMPATQHLTLLALLGLIVTELCLSRTHGIPFTCAYLPGRSRANITAPFAVVLLLTLSIVGADVERRAFQEPGRYAAIVIVLALAFIGTRVWTSWLADSMMPEFEDEPGDRIETLELWDSRVSPRQVGRHQLAPRLPDAPGPP